MERFQLRKFKNSVKYCSKKIAVFIINYNMTERADQLYEYLNKHTSYPIDIYMIDNGSDLVSPSKYTNVWIKKNIHSTQGWLKGIREAKKKNSSYFAYMFLITSAEFNSNSKDPILSLADILIKNPNVVGVHPSLSKDSTTHWTHLINQGTNGIRQTWFIDNIASLYRADWFDSIGQFDKNLIYAWGIDLETCYIARKQDKALYIDERIEVKKITNIGYKMNRMNLTSQQRTKYAYENMKEVLSKKYGKNWESIMLNDYVADAWKTSSSASIVLSLLLSFSMYSSTLLPLIMQEI